MGPKKRPAASQPDGEGAAKRTCAGEQPLEGSSVEGEEAVQKEEEKKEDKVADGEVEEQATTTVTSVVAPDAASKTIASSDGTSASGLKAVLLPISEGLALPSRSDQLSAVVDVGKALLNDWDLVIAGKPHCVCELEVYLHGPSHADPYTHGDDGQRSPAAWYFHKKGKSFKSGTFKGLDLAAGDRSKGTVAGVLLRAIRPLSETDGSPGDVLEGPCVVVDRILELNGKASISDFVAGREPKQLPAEATEGLSFRPALHPRDEKVWTGPRVGLVLRNADDKKTHSAGMPEDFCAAPYRISSAPRLLSKFRSGFAAAAHVGGMPQSEIGSLLGLSKVDEYIKATEKGLRDANPARFADKNISKQGDICELFGACHAFTKKSQS
mmetsp:Transcript_24250/g.52789  ORF Transcript_24250/g.52789 Transcript_24250/m.52789 type:complete len:382 (-) Transcript_24250:134-1279(-)|eukprot:CAMPEP_0206427000 /NCGR_PEP_ID=MMETSP0324_2-20121206/4753_1 /ASSEMBLY_ACC=CAM_ASM_000836 /TAXON_ID=2866 /ORGANISM="Crypthecodinium cohnii, Strain Seligo" /LENGTH=381 /DNA_ID=CAMNT_0053892143 /DNA_START=83 /DNA_END=1228 /DNA_ORIENTATION=-